MEMALRGFGAGVPRLDCRVVDDTWAKTRNQSALRIVRLSLSLAEHFVKSGAVDTDLARCRSDVSGLLQGSFGELTPLFGKELPDFFFPQPQLIQVFWRAGEHSKETVVPKTDALGTDLQNF